MQRKGVKLPAYTPSKTTCGKYTISASLCKCGKGRALRCVPSRRSPPILLPPHSNLFGCICLGHRLHLLLLSRVVDLLEVVGGLLGSLWALLGGVGRLRGSQETAAALRHWCWVKRLRFHQQWLDLNVHWQCGRFFGFFSVDRLAGRSAFPVPRDYFVGDLPLRLRAFHCADAGITGASMHLRQLLPPCWRCGTPLPK